MRTKLFGRVRLTVQKRLLLGRPNFGAALLAVQRLADDIGRLPMYSVRAGHTYHLSEFIDLQVQY